MRTEVPGYQKITIKLQKAPKKRTHKVPEKTVEKRSIKIDPKRNKKYKKEPNQKGVCRCENLKTDRTNIDWQK